MLQHLLVSLQRALVVLLLVEPVLGDRHPGVGDVAGARVLIEDGLEVLDRLADLPLVAQRERVQVDDRVDLAELRIVVDEAQVDGLRLRQVDGRRLARDVRAVRAIRVARRDRVLVLPHLLDVDGLRLFPVELGQLVQRLGLLLGMRAVAQVALEQANRLAARGGDLRLLLVQRLQQNGRQLDLGVAALVSVVGFVRLSTLVRGGGLLLRRVGARREERQREQQRQRDLSICSSHTRRTSTHLRTASIPRRRPSTPRAARSRTDRPGSGPDGGSRSRSRASSSCR